MVINSGADTEAEPEPAKPDRRPWWRIALVVLLVTVSTASVPLAVLATWAGDEIADTDRYVETVTPLAEEPAIQDAVSERVTREVVRRIDLERLAGDALSALGSKIPQLRDNGRLPRAFAEQGSNEIRQYVSDEVDAFARSEAFRPVWVDTNRLAHTSMVAVLTGGNTGLVDASGDVVTIQLGPIVDGAKRWLVDRGMVLAAQIPPVETGFAIFTAEDAEPARRAFDRLEEAALWLPIVAVVTSVAAVAVARSRRRTLLALGVAVALAMVLLGVAVHVVRGVYLDGVPERVLPQDAAAAVFDALVGYIRTVLRVIGIAAATVAVGAFLYGRLPLDRLRRRSPSGAAGPPA